MDFSYLKSGSDVRGVAVAGVAGEPVTLTAEVAARIAGAFVQFLTERVQKSAEKCVIAVGRDSRISGPTLESAVCTALQSAGAKVVSCGLATTPAMFMTTVDLACDGAVQITASHHPYHRNGLKFFTREGGLEGADISRILNLAGDVMAPAPTAGTMVKVDYMRDYAARLRKMIADGVGGGDLPLAGMKIAVDAGNGVGGFYATEVLAPLGADVSGSQFLEPDGMFPNHIPNPENPDAMAAISAAVKKAGADLGVIFDTDVDRAACVDSHGNEINRNALIALASCIALEGHPGGTVVTDSVTSDGLKWFIESALGGVHCRFKRGYRNVIDEAIRLNSLGIDAPLAIETSGHAAMRENYFLDDGAYLITKIIIKAVCLRREGSSIEELIAALPQPAEAIEKRFSITAPDFRTYGEAVLADLEAYAKKQRWALADDSREGVRISFGDGWALLRLSVHDPVMPLNIESNRAGGCDEILQKLTAFLQQYGQLKG